MNRNSDEQPIQLGIREMNRNSDEQPHNRHKNRTGTVMNSHNQEHGSEVANPYANQEITKEHGNEVEQTHVQIKKSLRNIAIKRTEGLNDQSSTQDLSKQLGYSSELDSDNSHEQERKKKKTETNDDEWNGHTSNKLGVLCRQDKVCEKLQVLKNETDVQISVENESGTQPCSVEENFPQLSAENSQYQLLM
ncbi:uncharacterized protein LOC143242009 [Tachypleus tridentatus]|uniref:uncharacterized protein LOC143242009 n=1 Tax=Tachypleus tridentatus TaxID=6853 RepID=UPI003FD0E6E9